ncbi:MAG: hypothetical protein MUE51_02100 [Thermoleophilia bacterium]|jgi:hypothetical protein|nr:hypothetical protein [Thermoleophilia bacterium]
MTVSVILRLAPAAVRVGRLAGQVELIATGETATIRDAEELLAFLAAAAAPPADDEVRPRSSPG